MRRPEPVRHCDSGPDGVKVSAEPEANHKKQANPTKRGCALRRHPCSPIMSQRKRYAEDEPRLEGDAIELEDRAIEIKHPRQIAGGNTEQHEAGDGIAKLHRSVNREPEGSGAGEPNQRVRKSGDRGRAAAGEAATVLAKVITLIEKGDWADVE